MWIIFFSVPIVVHIVAQRSAVGLKFDFLKENENKPWWGVKYSVQVVIFPHRLPWSAFLGPRCYYWCCCVCSQRPWGLGPQFCLETRSIMVRLFPGRGGVAFGLRWENLSLQANLHDSYWQLEHFISTPFTPIELVVVLYSFHGIGALMRRNPLSVSWLQKTFNKAVNSQTSPGNLSEVIIVF